MSCSPADGQLTVELAHHADQSSICEPLPTNRIRASATPPTGRQARPATLSPSVWISAPCEPPESFRATGPLPSHTLAPTVETPFIEPPLNQVLVHLLGSSDVALNSSSNLSDQLPLGPLGTGVPLAGGGGPHPPGGG